ncbi:PREDICTED: cytochrome P450 4C1-like [Wasmannia auropunctata]|uniref:cytochrome P450 4C1-like n=1 Tax=Wasmannia auropunctata TaxID=64793 RepID=UPI0005ED7C97|nr:PREDICTED: cytochrome P450 4C1-like [Wasmannia auropunctata]
MAKTVLYSKNCIDKGIPYKIVMPLFGTGLLTAPESIWTRMRKMTAPIFGSHVLQDFFNKFVKHSVQFTHELEKIGINGHEIVYVNYLMNCSWKIASDCLMGVQLEPQKNNKVINILHSLKECFSYRLMNLYIYFFDIVFHFSTMGRKTKKYVNLFHSLVNEIIQQSEDELSNLNTIKDKEKQICKLLIFYINILRN